MPKYYNASPVLSYKRPYTIVVGVRSIGKTYRFTKLCIKKALEQRSKAFVWVRRYQDDIDDIRTTFFDDMSQNNEFPTFTFNVKGNIMSATEKESGERFVIGEFIALSQAQRKKSSPRPSVKLVVFDEFLAEDGRYLTNEVNAFYSICYSIFRTERPVRAVLLANAVSIINPYFAEWGITNVDKRFTSTANVVVENCDDASFRKYAKQSSFGKSVEGSDYAQYAIDNKFLLDDNSNVDETESNSFKPHLNLRLHGVVLTLYLTSDNRWYFARAKDLSLKCYTIYVEDSLNSTAIFINKTDDAYKKIVKYIASEYAKGNCFFDSLEVKNEIVLLSRLIIKNF